MVIAMPSKHRIEYYMSTRQHVHSGILIRNLNDSAREGSKQDRVTDSVYLTT